MIASFKLRDLFQAGQRKYRIQLLGIALGCLGTGHVQAATTTEDAAAVITKLLDGLAVGTPKEYERIPDIWRPSLAAGKRNDAAELKRLLDLSMPKADEPLRHWQAVVIGGGIINGLSMQGVWPQRRIKELFKDDATMTKRWNRVLDLADKMASDEKVPVGTRYDALRILGADSSKARAAHLEKYLVSDNEELQMGAISGLSDMEDADISGVVLASLKKYKDSNRKLAVDALLRTAARKAKLLSAIETGQITSESLTPEQLNKLKSAGLRPKD